MKRFSINQLRLITVELRGLTYAKLLQLNFCEFAIEFEEVKRVAGMKGEGEGGEKMSGQTFLIFDFFRHLHQSFKICETDYSCAKRSTKKNILHKF